jgi:cyclopropane fatty-acyl-phospholipid synthase-like methyltransferase
LNHFTSLCLPIQGKTVLEPGCGPGLMAKPLVSARCTVYGLEARKELVEFYNTFHKSNTARSHLFNLENGDWTTVPECDITYCYGTLYHLGNPDEFLRNISEKTKEFCVIETVVSVDSALNDANIVTENKVHINQSFEGRGCRPTRKYVWDTLAKYFPKIYMPLTQPVSVDFPKDFKHQYNPIQRFIIIGSKIDLNLPTLSDSFVTTYQ